MNNIENFEDVELSRELKENTNEFYSLYNYMEVYNDILPSNSIFKNYINKYPKKDFFEVTSKNKDRLDLISREIYGTPHLWWFLAMFNNIINPDKIEKHIIYYIPLNILKDIFSKFYKKGCNKIDTEVKNKMF